MAKMTKEIMELLNDPKASKVLAIADAPLGIAVVLNHMVSIRPVENGAVATQSMLLEAHSLGPGACWIGCHGTDKEVRTKRIIDIPEEERPPLYYFNGQPC